MNTDEVLIKLDGKINEIEEEERKLNMMENKEKIGDITN